MRLPRPRLRLRLRTLLIAVAVAGLILGAETIRRRWSYYRARAEDAGRGEAIILGGAWGYRLTIDESGEEHWVVDSAENLRLLRHYRALRRKYERAASRPWSSVPPDPPPPSDWVPTPDDFVEIR